jgi:hypothetical protein
MTLPSVDGKKGVAKADRVPQSLRRNRGNPDRFRRAAEHEASAPISTRHHDLLGISTRELPGCSDWILGTREGCDLRVISGKDTYRW